VTFAVVSDTLPAHMRYPSLEPKKLKNSNAPRQWYVDIPPRFSDTGKQQRLFFATREEAETQTQAIWNRRQTFGETLEQLSPARASEALAAYRLLAGINVTLLDAVRGFLEVHRQRTGSLPFEKLFDSYLIKIARKSEKHRVAMRQTRDRFPDLLPMLAVDITAAKLDELLLPLPPASRDLILRHWRSVFRYGRKKGYVMVSPTERLDFAGTEIKEVQIYSVEDVRKLLNDALENDLGLLPFYLLGAFCGLRPEGESEGLEWNYVHADGKNPHVSIPATISKVGKFREVELPKNVATWLEAYQQRGGSMEGKVVPWSHSALRKRRTASAERAGVSWIQDGLRHSFASYWLPIHHNIDRLLLMMGHSDVSTFGKHYHSGVPAAEAKKFWAILPPKRKGSL
jgi:integrase